MILGPFVLLRPAVADDRERARGDRPRGQATRTPIENYSPAGGVSPAKLIGDVEFENVRFAYKANNETLRGISFHARAGQKIALVGESGVGKTTIIDLLSGFLLPTKKEKF